MFVYGDWEIPKEDIWRFAVALEEVVIGYKNRNSLRLKNGFDLRFWRGNTAVFWEYTNYNLGVSLTNSDSPMYFPEAKVIVRKALNLLNDSSFTETAGNIVLRKDGNKFLITPIGEPEWEDFSDPLKRAILSIALKERSYFKNYGWFITRKMATYKGKRVEPTHKVYLFFEIGLYYF